MEPGSRLCPFLQTGGDPESLAALLSGGIESLVCLLAADRRPGDRARLSLRHFRSDFENSLYGYGVCNQTFAVPAKRAQAMANYMHVMAEASKIMHTDREFVYKVLGKYLRVSDRNIMDGAYNAEIKALSHVSPSSTRRCKRFSTKWRKTIQEPKKKAARTHRQSISRGNGQEWFFRSTMG